MENFRLPKSFRATETILASTLLSCLLCLSGCLSDSPSEEKFLPGEWTEQRAMSGQYPNDIVFLDAETGWACGYGDSLKGFVLRTKDGGLTWTEAKVQEAPLNAMTFLDKNTGWAVGDGGSILKTTDGGVTWVPKSSGVESRLNAVTFVSASTGWVVGEQGAILKTTDGGNTWVSQYDEELPYLSDVHFFDANTGIAVGHDVLRTTNGGALWTIQEVDWANPLMFNYIAAISFSDSKNGWAAGSWGNFLRTTDGGKTWRSEVLESDATITDVWSFGGGRGYIARGNFIHATTDDGKTWEDVDAPGKYLTFVGRNRGWAVGNAGIYAYAPSVP